MKKKKNRPHLLLELIIAFSILAACALPLVRNPMAVYQQELLSLQKIELERLAEVSFLEIKEKLYKQEIPWKALEKKKEKTPDFQDTVTLEIDGVCNKTFVRKYYFWTTKEKEGQNREEYKLVHLQIRFTPEVKKKGDKSSLFSHDLFVQRA